MVKGILADHDIDGQVEYLAALLRLEPWARYWIGLAITIKHFDDVGLSAESTDREVWRRAQDERLVLITGNRNMSGPDSLESTIRSYNEPDSLPIFTIADLDRLNNSRSYADDVLKTMLDYLDRLDTLLGVGRLWLP